MFKGIKKIGTKLFAVVVCDHCGKELTKTMSEVPPKRRTSDSVHLCNRKCKSGKIAASRWKGGTCQHTKGYVVKSIGKGKKILEHRYIMEQLLGRALFTYETVHHRDGNRANNNPENLQLLVVSEHPYGIETQHLVDINNLIQENQKLKEELECLILKVGKD